MRLLVTGATGFLGSRLADLLAARGHDVTRLARPDGRRRSAAERDDLVRLDAGDPAARELVAGCNAVLHFAGVPNPSAAAADPARAVRENAGTTANLLDACATHGAGLVYPSTARAALDPPPDAYALSKRLGEEACRLHPARATVVRLTSVFGPGQIAAEGATGAIASFAHAALAGEPIVIPGNPERARDFVLADDLAAPLERIVAEGRWGETLTIARGTSTPLRTAAELVLRAAGSDARIETPGGGLAPGENESYEAAPPPAWLGFEPISLEEGIERYVGWLRSHPAAQGRP